MGSSEAKMNIGIIIGNGPSLNKVPKAFLNKYPTIGSNLIYLMEGFTPTYYTNIDISSIREDNVEHT